MPTALARRFLRMAKASGSRAAFLVVSHDREGWSDPDFLCAVATARIPCEETYATG